MSGLAEKALFGALAAGLHVLAFASVPGGGAESRGAGGEQLVTLQGATPQLSAMVSDWSAPPEVARDPQVAALAPPPEPAPAIVPPQIERRDHPAVPAARPDLPRAPVDPLSVAPPLPRPALPEVPALLPAPPVGGASAPAQLAPAPPAAPRPTAIGKPDAPAAPSPPDLARATEPAVAPALAKPKARPQRQERASSAAAPAQRASGSGGAAQAGTGGRAETATLSTGKRRSLMASWGAGIRTRIERRKQQPRGLRGGGRVVLDLQVGRTGELRAVAIRQSSGDADLDAAALRAVRRAGRFPAAPEGLTDPVYRFSLPIRFNR